MRACDARPRPRGPSTSVPMSVVAHVGGDAVLRARAARPGAPRPARQRPCRRDRRRRSRPRRSRRRSRTSRAVPPRRRLSSASWSASVSPGVADDEVGPERGIGLAAGGCDRCAPGRRSPSPQPAHAAHQRRRDVLERQIEVRHRAGGDQLDEFVGQLGGVQVQQPDPVPPARTRRRRAPRCALAGLAGSVRSEP